MPDFCEICGTEVSRDEDECMYGHTRLAALTYDEVWNAAMEEAAQLVESKAPYTEEQINNTPALTQLEHIHGVTRSDNARKDAAAIRALIKEKADG